MKPPPLAVAFREVRHFRPEDWLHCEPVALRGEAMAWTIPAHRHERLHQFMFLSTGAAKVTLDDVRHAMSAPAMPMVAPGSVHAIDLRRRRDGVQVTVPSARLEQALAEAPLLWASLRSRSRATSGVTDGAGAPLGVIETLAVEVVPFDQVDADFAATEGEGDGSLAFWREAHRAFFTRECVAAGRTFVETMPVVCERFRLVYRGSADPAKA